MKQNNKKPEINISPRLFIFQVNLVELILIKIPIRQILNKPQLSKELSIMI